MKKTTSYLILYFSVFLLLCVLPSSTNNSREKNERKERNNIFLQELKLTGLKTNADFQAGKTELIPTKNHEILILNPVNEIVSGDNSKKQWNAGLPVLFKWMACSRFRRDLPKELPCIKAPCCLLHQKVSYTLLL